MEWRSVESSMATPRRVSMTLLIQRTVVANIVSNSCEADCKIKSGLNNRCRCCVGDVGRITFTPEISQE